MRSFARRAAAVVVAIGAAGAIAGLSRVPYAAADGDHAVLRLSWRIPSAQVEECRRLSEEEVARQPEHMRREEVCERRRVPYRVRLRLDGQVVVDEVVQPSGAREDRPLYVFRELRVQPGSYAVELVWEQEGVGATDPANAPVSPAPPTPTAGGAPRGGGVLRETPPSRLTLHAELRLQAGEISLITYDVDQRRLVARGRGLVASPEG